MRQQTQPIEIHGLTDSIAFCEAKGLSKCFQAYANHCAGDDIMMIGFNANSGYTFISLESGIQICSMLGRKVEFLVTDFETGEENFFDSFEEAENKMNEAQ